MADITLLIAFLAGVLGFLSPCIVPLIPGYLSFVSGLSLEGMSPAERRRHVGRVLLATILFVLGFALIFTGMGASASLLGALVLENRRLLSRLGGLVVIALGIGVLLRAPILFRERRLQVARRFGLMGALPVGMAFGFAWTPCVGPVLAAVLTLAATAESVGRAAQLLFAYSLGLGLPFMVSALLLTLAFDSLGGLRRYSRPITTVSGVFLLVMGTAMATDYLFALNTWILRLFPFRPSL